MPFDPKNAVPVTSGFDPANAIPVAAAPAQAAPAAPPGLLNRFGRDIEPWITAGTSALALPVAGWAGILSGGDPDAVKATQAALTYQPKTQGGQQGLAALGNVVQNVGNTLTTPVPTGALGDVNPISRYSADSGSLADAGSPGLATLHAMLPATLAALGTGGGFSAMTNVGRELPGMLVRAPGAAVDAGDALAGAVRAKFGADPMPVFPTPSDFPPLPSTPSIPVAGMPFPSTWDATPPAVAGAVPSDLQAVAAKVPNVNAAVLQRHAEAASLPVPMRLTAGQATGDVNLLSNEMNTRAGPMAQHLNDQNGQLVQNLSALRQQVAPDVMAPNQTELGQTLVDRYKALDAKLNDDVTAKYQALADANGGQIPIDGQTLTTSILDSLAASKKSAFLPETVKNYLGNFADGPLSFDDFEDLRTTLAKASRATTDGNAQAAISAVRNAVESLPLTDETEQIKPLADAARAAARNRFILIESDPAFKAVTNDSANITEPSPLADRFVQTYIASGKSANVGRMLSNLATVDPATKQEVAAGLMDHLRSQSGIDLRINTGNVTQSGLNKTLAAPGFAQKIDMAFDPNSAAQVRALGNVAQYTQQQGRGSYVNNSNTLVGSNVDRAKTAATAALQRALDVPNKWSLGALPDFGTQLRQKADNAAVLKTYADSTKLGAGLDYVSPNP